MLKDIPSDEKRDGDRLCIPDLPSHEIRDNTEVFLCHIDQKGTVFLQVILAWSRFASRCEEAAQVPILSSRVYCKATRQPYSGIFQDVDAT